MSPQCPVCRNPIEWQRRFLKAWAWAKWPCPECGSTLGFSMKRRMMLGIAGGALGIIVSIGLRVAPIRSFKSAILLAMVLFMCVTVLFFFGLRDKIVAIERQGAYCESCGYNRAGSLSPRCPECGHERPVPPVAKPAE